jgi:hypothetical protein
MLSMPGETIAWGTAGTDPETSSLDDSASQAGASSAFDPATEPDLLSRYKDFLGKSVSQLGSAVGHLAAEAGWDVGDRWRRYRADSWIAVVQLGYMSGPRPDSGETLRRAVIGTRRPPLVRPPGSANAAVVAADNRSLLPPFPMGEGREDAVFGCLLGLMYPHAIGLELPFTLINGVKQRSVDDGGQFGANDVLLFLLKTLALPEAIDSAGTRLALAGRYLCSCAAASAATFHDLLMCSAVQCLACSSAPSSLSQPASRSVTPAGADVSNVAASLIVDMSLTGAREELLRFGNLLVEWQGIRQAALQLRQAAQCTS